MKKKPRVLFISSTGGHLSEMMQLKPLFEKYDYRIITENTKSNQALKEIYPNKVSYMIYGSKVNMLTYPFKLIGNCFKSLSFYFKFKPQYIITTGTHTAAPMCCIGHLFGSKVIYIETFANISTKTVTGKYIYKFADLFVVQWKSMQKLYPNAKFGGWIY